MVTPEVSLNISAALAATDWPVCFSILIVALMFVALFAKGSPIAFTALGGLIATGIGLAVLASGILA